MVLQGFVAENIEKTMVFQCSEAKTIDKNNGFRTPDLKKHNVFHQYPLYHYI